jgi:tetraacyldisaccharide 4'-kinase
VIHKIEDMFFRFDKLWHILLSLLLLPLSFIYCAIGIFKKLLSTPEDMKIPIISVGNLTVGGSGKTPFVIELCKLLDSPCVVSRGYGRRSKGVVVVSRNGAILYGVKESGDEAMLIAKKAANATVIVCEDRKKAILKAKELGCKSVVLDDGFGRFEIEKFDILLFPSTPFKNIFCLPSGPFRYPLFFEKFGDIVGVDGVDFKRNTTICDNNGEFVLITAIANPQRLDRFLPSGVVAKYYFADHHYFSKSEIANIMSKYPKKMLLCTQKDGVKLDELGVEYVALELTLSFDKDFLAFLGAKLSDRFGFNLLKNQTT